MKYLTIVLVVFLTAASLFAQARSATITEITGSVELKAPGSANWVTARVGDRLVNETVISTGFRSSAVLNTGSSTITLNPLTNMSLATIMDADNTESTNLDLRAGRVRVDVSPPAGTRANFSVQSPSTTASVRGTNFEMDSTNLRVNEGTVMFGSTTSAQPVVVIGGQTTWVNTETGRIVNTFDAGEINRALPVMPGQGSVPGTLRPQAEGQFVGDVILLPDGQ